MKHSCLFNCSLDKEEMNFNSTEYFYESEFFACIILCSDLLSCT